MNDGYCDCGGMFMLIKDGAIQTWACHDCKKLMYRIYNSLDIYFKFEDALLAAQKVL